MLLAFKELASVRVPVSGVVALILPAVIPPNTRLPVLVVTPKDVEALRVEVAQLRQEFASHLYGQDSEIQQLERRVRSVEQALPAPDHASRGAPGSDRT